MSKYTPWPWSKKAIAAILRNASKHDGIWLEECGEDEYIPDQDDASIIAAAPDLLEALEELSLLMDDVRNGEYTPDHLTTQPARAAIAKAKGEE